MSDLLKSLQAKQKKLGKDIPDIPSSAARIPLEEIGDRPGSDTRPLNQAHVDALTESIALLGLIEPLVIDSKSKLLAGGHRRAAIAQLSEVQPDIYDKHFADGVPVHRMGLDAELQPDLAIKIEVSENEQRRDYSPSEVRAIADRFREAGYGVKGRPGKDQSPLIPALMAVVGKSRATVKRYLSQDKRSGSSEPLKQKHLKSALNSLRRWEKLKGRSQAEKNLAGLLPELVEVMERLLGKD